MNLESYERGWVVAFRPEDFMHYVHMLIFTRPWFDNDDCWKGILEGNAAAGFPRLAGMSTAYVEEQLNNFADGKRQNPIMSPICKGEASGRIRKAC